MHSLLEDLQHKVIFPFHRQLINEMVENRIPTEVSLALDEPICFIQRMRYEEQ